MHFESPDHANSLEIYSNMHSLNTQTHFLNLYVLKCVQMFKKSVAGTHVWRP